MASPRRGGFPPRHDRNSRNTSRSQPRGSPHQGHPPLDTQPSISGDRAGHTTPAPGGTPPSQSGQPRHGYHTTHNPNTGLGGTEYGSADSRASMQSRQRSTEHGNPRPNPVPFIPQRIPYAPQQQSAAAEQQPGAGVTRPTSAGPPAYIQRTQAVLDHVIADFNRSSQPTNQRSGAFLQAPAPSTAPLAATASPAADTRRSSRSSGTAGREGQTRGRNAPTQVQPSSPATEARRSSRSRRTAGHEEQQLSSPLPETRRSSRSTRTAGREEPTRGRNAPSEAESTSPVHSMSSLSLEDRPDGTESPEYRPRNPVRASGVRTTTRVTRQSGGAAALQEEQEEAASSEPGQDADTDTEHQWEDIEGEDPVTYVRGEDPSAVAIGALRALSTTFDDFFREKRLGGATAAAAMRARHENLIGCIRRGNEEDMKENLIGKMDGIAKPLLERLYFVLTRICLPNAIRENRSFLFRLYEANRHRLKNLSTRYDCLYSTKTWLPETALPPADDPAVSTTSADRIHPPIPRDFIHRLWTWRDKDGFKKKKTAIEMGHRRTMLDMRMLDREERIAAMGDKQFKVRLSGVIMDWWHIRMGSETMRLAEANNWEGSEAWEIKGK